MTERKSLHVRNMHTGTHLLLGIVALIVLIPLYYVLLNAFKDAKYIDLNPMGFSFQHVTLNNIEKAWNTMKFPVALRNSALLVAISCSMMIVFGSLAGYAITIVNSRFMRVIFMVLVMLISVPFQVLMIPLAQILGAMNLLNNPFGTSLVFVAMALPFTVFLYTGFMRSLPRELCEAAIVDGCGMGKAYLFIYMPLMKTVTGTILIIRGTTVWNDLLIPLTTNSNEKFDPLIRRLYSYCSLQFNRWDLLFAGTLLCSIPILILFLALQKTFISGITVGAVKG